MHLLENTLFDLDPKVKGFKVTRNVARYPQHHVIYAPAKFDVDTSHGEGKDTFTKNTFFDHDLI